QEAHGLHHRLDTVKLVKGTENNSRAEESADGVRRLASLRRKVLARDDEHVAGALKAEALEDVASAREEIGPRALQVVEHDHDERVLAADPIPDGLQELAQPPMVQDVQTLKLISGHQIRLVPKELAEDRAVEPPGLIIMV